MLNQKPGKPSVFKKAEVVALCKNLKKYLCKSVNQDMRGFALALGNFFLCMEEEEYQQDANVLKTWELVKTSLSAEIIAALLNNIEQIPLKLQDEGNGRTISALRLGFLREPIFLVQMTELQIRHFTRFNLSHRELMVALIRQHLSTKNMPDPFQIRQFSYHLLNAGGEHHNYLYLSQFMNQCQEIPIESIVKLNQNNALIAESLLKNFQNSRWYFELSVKFAEHFPALRHLIAQDWQYYFATYPLGTQSRYVKTQLKRLQTHYPEFEGLDTHTRSNRNGPVVTVDLSKQIYEGLFLTLTLSGAALLAPWVLSLAAQPCTLAGVACSVTNLVREAVSSKPLMLPVVTSLTWYADKYLSRRMQPLEFSQPFYSKLRLC